MAEALRSEDDAPGGWDELEGRLMSATVWADWLIPASMRAADSETRLRARLVVLAPMPFLLAAVPAAHDYYWGGSTTAAAIIAAFAGLAVLTPALLRLGIAPAGHAQLSLFVAVMAVLAWLSGGLGTPPLYSYVLIPIIGVLLLGRLPAVAWSLIACGVVAGFYVLERAGASPASGVTPTALMRGHAILEILGILVALAFTVLQDIQRRHAFGQLEHSRIQAEAASRAKGAFLANVSHELRTPMNGVLGMSSLLEDAGLEPRHREMVEVIRGSAQNLLTLLDDILDYSEIEAGRMRLRSEPFDLHDLVTGVVQLLAPLAEARGLRFEHSVEADAPRRLHADGGRIQQILVNLIGNAIKFTDAGSVALRVGVLEDASRPTLVLRVDDTGPGIPPAERRRIFERFERIDDTSSRRHAGTGLGLAICGGLVALCGGRISVESEVGVGSTFIVHLPLVVADETPALASEALPEPTRPAADLHALSVEDNVVNQLMTTRMLEQLGCRVTPVIDGEQALLALGQDDFDVVIMDCHMPRMDGFAATRAIRATPELASIPVIGLTASNTTQDQVRCRDVGMDEVLSKPCTLDRLGRAIVSCTKKRTEKPT